METTITIQPTKETSLSRDEGISWYSYLLLFSTISIVAGVIWDISWHMTIGRDTLFSPPHLAIYLGGILAGLSSFWKIIHISFWGSEVERNQSVSFWGMRAPLGTLFCLWGAGAMITSAPFDDWWHNTYGLDVKILSPPHVLLSLGIACIQMGTMLNLLTHQNTIENTLCSESQKRQGRFAFAFSMGLMMIIIGIFILEFSGRGLMHSPLFYQIICGAYPLSMITGLRASRLRWPAATIALVYMGIMMLQVWFFPLFSASPKLSPIKYNVDHMVPLPFPLFMIVPAILIDIIARKIETKNLWKQAMIIGSVFFVSFLIFQWNVGEFLMTPYARNWIFATHEWPYYLDLSPRRFTFWPYHGSSTDFYLGLLYALVICILSCRLALAWGNWMRRVQR